MSEDNLRNRTPSPYLLPTGEGFVSAAAKLAGLAGALLGWRPDEFWNATPAELATVIAALAGDEPKPLDANDLARLKEMFPDG
ncbi:MAG: phage tail assembly chaperone [Alphaproteobacteria bacterium]|nr:MAG: phage tail assembly chaperone [Alphaproteobacteria bacterium]